VGLVHGRELLIRSIRSFPLPILAVVLACGGGRDAPDPGLPDSTLPDVAPAAGEIVPDSAATLVGILPEGGPMPRAETAGGIPPYPGAAVRTAREQTPEMRSFEAYTPDEWTRVVAWFDSQLGPPAWSRVQAEDMVIYQKGEDEAAITVSPWQPELLRPGAPEYMQRAQTAIGAAWRP
jgi:hypothetical protein